MAQYVKTIAAAEVSPGQGKLVELQGRKIAVFNVGGSYYAIDDTCTHQRASLSDGWLDGCMVECPLHATCFDLRTGLPDGPPAKVPVRTHQVVVMDGMIYLKLAEHSGEPEVEVA